MRAITFMALWCGFMAGGCNNRTQADGVGGGSSLASISITKPASISGVSGLRVKFAKDPGNEVVLDKIVSGTDLNDASLSVPPGNYFLTVQYCSDASCKTPTYDSSKCTGQESGKKVVLKAGANSVPISICTGAGKSAAVVGGKAAGASTGTGGDAASVSIEPTVQDGSSSTSSGTGASCKAGDQLVTESLTQESAEATCSAACAKVAATWNKQWTNIDDTGNANCGCVCSATSKPSTAAAPATTTTASTPATPSSGSTGSCKAGDATLSGGLFAQSDADSQCPAACTSQSASWNKNWSNDSNGNGLCGCSCSSGNSGSSSGGGESSWNSLVSESGTSESSCVAGDAALDYGLSADVVDSTCSAACAASGRTWNRQWTNDDYGYGLCGCACP